MHVAYMLVAIMPTLVSAAAARLSKQSQQAVALLLQVISWLMTSMQLSTTLLTLVILQTKLLPML